jgi:hypothetical protein
MRRGSSGRAMTDFGGSIPAGMISICKAFETVYQALTPDREVLEERVNPSSPFHHGLSEQDAKCSREEAWRSYDQRRLRASEWLREKLSQGSLIAQFQKKKRDQQLSPHRWASMGPFKAMGIFETGIAIVAGKRRRLYFDPKEYDKFLSEIAPSTTGIDTAPLIDTPRVTDKGGRPPEYNWDAIRAFALQKIKELGKPHKSNKALPTKAQLIELIQHEWSDKHHQDLGYTTVRDRLNQWLAENGEN